MAGRQRWVAAAAVRRPTSYLSAAGRPDHDLGVLAHGSSGCVSPPTRLEPPYLAVARVISGVLCCSWRSRARRPSGQPQADTKTSQSICSGATLRMARELGDKRPRAGPSQRGQRSGEEAGPPEPDTGLAAMKLDKCFFQLPKLTPTCTQRAVLEVYLSTAISSVTAARRFPSWAHLVHCQQRNILLKNSTKRFAHACCAYYSLSAVPQIYNGRPGGRGVIGRLGVAKSWQLPHAVRAQELAVASRAADAPALVLAPCKARSSAGLGRGPHLHSGCRSRVRGRLIGCASSSFGLHADADCCATCRAAVEWASGGALTMTVATASALPPAPLSGPCC